MIKTAFSIVLMIMLCGCASPARVIIVPTLAELPTVTPETTEAVISTDTATAESTSTATQTLVPDMNTAQAQLTALNATIDALMTATPTTAPTATTTPPPSVIELAPQQFSVQAESSLRQCPNRGCAEITLLAVNTVLQVDALVYGEEVAFGNSLWYRVRLEDGSTGYVFSTGASPLPPTLVNAAGFPTMRAAAQPPTGASGALSQPVDTSLCPSVTAHCTTLQTCDQARACLALGDTTLDRDGDGIPCESLCAGN